MEFVANLNFVSVPSRLGFKRLREPETHQSVELRSASDTKPQAAERQTFCQSGVHVAGPDKVDVSIDIVVEENPYAHNGVMQTSVSAYPAEQPLIEHVKFAISETSLAVLAEKRHR